MKKKIMIFSLLIMSVFISTASAEDSQITWTTGTYSNNTNISKTLTIPDATTLIVTLIGETEQNYDFITIKDKNGNVVKKLSGSINETFEVSGDVITANLKSDYSVTKSGVTVSIAPKNIGKKGLILNPKKGTVLGHEGVHFEVAEGVTKLYYIFAGAKMPIKDNYLRYIDTSRGSLKVCAEKEDGIASCQNYKVEKDNPFNVSLTNYSVNFQNAELALLYHSSSLSGYSGNYNKFLWTKNVKGKTSHRRLGDNDFGHYTLVLCGYNKSKWMCQSVFMGSFPM